MTGAANDLFEQINNAVLDLQGAGLQTYQRPLKTLGRLLQHPDLKEINAELTEGVDLDQFMQKSRQTKGGMSGSGALAWPDDHREALGISLQLIEMMANKPDTTANLG